MISNASPPRYFIVRSLTELTAFRSKKARQLDKRSGLWDKRRTPDRFRGRVSTRRCYQQPEHGHRKAPDDEQKHASAPTRTQAIRADIFRPLPNHAKKFT